MENLETLRRNHQKTIPRSPTGQCVDLEVETECTSIRSDGETIALLFLLSKNVYRASSICETACQVPGKHRGCSDGSKVYRKEAKSATYGLKVLGQVLRSH